MKATQLAQMMGEVFKTLGPEAEILPGIGKGDRKLWIATNDSDESLWVGYVDCAKAELVWKEDKLNEWRGKV